MRNLMTNNHFRQTGGLLVQFLELLETSKKRYSVVSYCLQILLRSHYFS